MLPQDKRGSLGLKFKPTLGIRYDGLPQVPVMVYAHARNWLSISVNDDTLNTHRLRQKQLTVLAIEEWRNRDNKERQFAE